MLNKLNDLQFVIGAFFTVIACVLFANILINGQNDNVSIYTAGTFVIFGLLMMFVRKRKSE